MPRKRVAEVNLRYTVCGVVSDTTLRKLHDRVTFDKPLAVVVGEILEEWGRHSTRVVQTLLDLTGKGEN